MKLKHIVLIIIIPTVIVCLMMLSNRPPEEIIPTGFTLDDLVKIIPIIVAAVLLYKLLETK